MSNFRSGSRRDLVASNQYANKIYIYTIHTTMLGNEKQKTVIEEIQSANTVVIQLSRMRNLFY